MNRLIKIGRWAVSVAIAIVVAAILGSVWFGLWMDDGWPGATGMLATVLHLSGEAAYDAMQLEMTVWIFAGLSALGAAALFVWRRSRT